MQNIGPLNLSPLSKHGTASLPWNTLYNFVFSYVTFPVSVVSCIQGIEFERNIGRSFPKVTGEEKYNQNTL